MSPKIDEKIDVLTPAAEEPITDYELVQAKINHDGYEGYRGIENIALQNSNVKKQHTNKVKP